MLSKSIDFHWFHNCVGRSAQLTVTARLSATPGHNLQFTIQTPKFPGVQRGRESGGSREEAGELNTGGCQLESGVILKYRYHY